MFNLIVSGGLESDRRGSIMAERVLEYTSDQLSDEFKPSGNLDVSAVLDLPTILMEEGTADEVVYLGWLTRVQKRGREYHLQYAVDPDVPVLTNADIYALASELHIEEFEFHRNHWAIKDVDLFQVLYRQKA